jgi:hypothetical protein
MFARHIIRHSAALLSYPASAGRVLLLASVAAISGCQLVLDDISLRTNSAEAGAPMERDATAPDGGENENPSEGAGHAPSMDEDAGQDRDDAAQEPLLDGAKPPSPTDGAAPHVQTDAAAQGEAGSGTRDTGAVAQDSGATGPDAAAACSEPVWWYQDDDEDGYGRSSSRVRACPPPADRSWALQEGDCNDDDALVHPGQSEYFDVAYAAPDGSESFDYDCSGAEEGNDQQQASSPDYCGLLLSIALCTGSGYLPSDRPGAPNPWCGSHIKAACQGVLLGALVCGSIVNEVTEPYWCH